jgi:CelD/BcsL family acetyltransferase involved in cellulose biosynthesis
MPSSSSEDSAEGLPLSAERLRPVPAAAAAPPAAGPAVQETRALAGWEAQWDALVDRSALPSPFLRSWWLRHTTGETPCFVLVTDADRLLGGVALQRDTVLGVARYRVAGHGRLAPEHLDLVTAEEHRGLVEAHLRTWCHRDGARLFDLHGLVEHPALARVLPSPRAAITHTAPYRRLPDDPEAALATLPRSTRRAVAKGRRQLAEAGGQHRVVPDHDLDAALERFRDLHLCRWGDESGLHGSMDALFAAVRAAARRGEARLHELWGPDGTIAIDLCFELRGRVTNYQGGRRHQDLLRAPGTVLLSHVVEHATRNGADEFDLLGGAHPYKRRWTDAERGVVQLEAAHGRAGTAVLGALRTRRTCAATVRRGRRSALTVAEAVRSRARILTRPDTRTGAAGGDIRIVRDLHELAQLRSRWSALPVEAVGVTGQLDWVLAHASALTETHELCVVVIDRGRDLQAAAPLLRTRKQPFPRLQLPTTEMTEFLARNPDDLDRLCDAVLRLGLPLELDGLVTGSATEERLRAHARRRRAPVVSHHREGGPTIRLDGDPRAKLSRRRRARLARLRRRADEAFGSVTFDPTAPGDDLLAAFADFIALEDAGWKGRAGTSLAKDDRQRTELERYLSAPAIRDHVRICQLRFGDTVVAAQLDILVERRLWYLKSAYDEAYSRFAPGLQLFVDAVVWAAGQGLEGIETLGTPSDDKLMWNEPPRSLTSLRIYPTTPAGLAGLGQDAAAKLVRVGRRRFTRRATSPSA